MVNETPAVDWTGVDARDDKWRPKRATVTAVSGATVKVEIAQTGAETGFIPCVVDAVTVGTTGAIVRYSRQHRLFIPDSVAAANTSHAHSIANVTGLQAALDTKTVKIGMAGFVDWQDTTAVVTAYTSAASLWSTTLQTIIPDTATGTWDVYITATFAGYRSVSTGGIYGFVGLAGVQRGVVLLHNAPMTNIVSGTAYGAATGCVGTNAIDFRYAGYSTAGTTNVSLHGVQVIAVRTA